MRQARGLPNELIQVGAGGGEQDTQEHWAAVGDELEVAQAEQEVPPAQVNLALYRVIYVGNVAAALMWIAGFPTWVVATATSNDLEHLLTPFVLGVISMLVLGLLICYGLAFPKELARRGPDGRAAWPYLVATLYVGTYVYALLGFAFAMLLCTSCVAAVALGYVVFLFSVQLRYLVRFARLQQGDPPYNALPADAAADADADAGV
jgi:hypothetical protein